MNFNLKNKKVLITGSSGGIGSSLSKIFLKMECKIIFTSSDNNKLNELKNKFGNENTYYLLNLSDLNSLPSSISKITEENTDIDIFINNAGISKDNLFLRMKVDQWNEVINVNLNSNFFILKSILPNMIKNKKGNIIGITSVVANTGADSAAVHIAMDIFLDIYREVKVGDVFTQNLFNCYFFYEDCARP